MAQERSQTVRFGDETIQMETVSIRGIECLRLEDVQRRFPWVTALYIDNLQLAFIADEHGKSLEPLHVKACKDRVIDALEPLHVKPYKGQVIEALAPTTVSNIDLTDQFKLISEQFVRFQKTLDRIDANTQEILNQMRYVMTQMYELHEFTTPRYFFILPVQHHDWAAINTVQDLFQVHYKLYFLCECSDEPEKLHIAPHDGYSIKKPQAFIAKYGPYLRTTQCVVEQLLALGHFIIPLLGVVSTVVGNSSFDKSSTALNEIKNNVKIVERLLDKTGIKLNRAVSPKLQNEKSQRAPLQDAGPLQGANLRELESYLQLVDSKNSLGNLYRIVTTDGHVRWVCLEHYNAISFNNQTLEYIRQLETIGGQFNEEKKEAVIDQVNLTNKNVTMLCETLKKGFNIAKLVLQKCSIDESDLDILLDVIINRSSIQCLKMTALDLDVFVLGWIRTSKYVCEYMILHFNNQSLKVRCHDHYQSGNAQVLTRVLMQNKIHRTLDFSACDFLGQEQELRRCLDANGMLTGLVVNYSNNVDILNAISTLKTNTLHQLKLNYSLGLPSTSSRFCEIIKNNRTLVEIDLMDSSGFADETFIINLLSTLREHKSIKHLNLHVCYVTPSSQKEDCLKNSLLNDKFISRLCLSKSVISHQLTQALVHASQEHRSLTHLEFYDSQMNADDVSKLQWLYKNETLIHLIISEEPSNGLKKEQLFIPNFNFNQTWKQYGTTTAGGHRKGNELNQLSFPHGFYIDDDQTIYVADYENNRIVEWKNDANHGQIVAGGNGKGNRDDQLNEPTKVIVDKETDSLIICDSGNRRIVQWPRRNGRSGKTLISNIACWNLIMDNDRYLYVSDQEQNEVRRWKIGETNETLVAGGNGQGDRLDQLDYPTNIFIDEDHSVYVSDCLNHRVMKWLKDAKEGIVVAGGQGQGNGLKQLSNPHGILVDQFGSVYVADSGNHRVIRWLKGAREGTIVVGGNAKREQTNQFDGPMDLSFDCQNNLYVVDSGNHRVQKFDIN